MFEVAYSINGELKKVYFSMKEDALKFYDDILHQNKDKDEFEYINLTEMKLIGHYSKCKGLMRG